MRNRRTFFRTACLLLCLLLARAVPAAPNEKDSLLKGISFFPTPQKITALNRLAEIFRKTSIDSTYLFAKQALNLATGTNDKKGMGNAYNHIGNYYYFKGDYPMALDFHQKSFLCRQQAGDSMGMANSLNNIGVNYRRMDDYDKALDYYLRSLELKEKLGEKGEVISSLNNIGGVYYYQRNYNKAAEYYNKALNIAIDLNDSLIIAASYNNLSLIFDQKKEYLPALEMANFALRIREKLEDPGFVAVSLNNIGRIYEHKEELDKALDYYSKAIDLYKKIGDTPNLANTLYNVGNIYLTLKQYNKAISIFEQSLDLSKDIDNRLQLRDIYHGLAFGNHYLSRNDKAFDYMLKYIDLNDSIFDEESLTKMSEMEVKYQSEKKLRDIEALKREAELKDQKQEADQKRQKVIIAAFIAGIVLMLFVAALLFNRYQLKQKANEKLEASNKEILLQKALVDEKNTEITDSIYYALKIQQALLPSVADLDIVLPGSFLFFKPKDIVSGDFYWLSVREEHIYFAAVDCTGHGVPGGFMSMLGTSLLNEVVNEKKISEPAAILDMLRVKVILALKQKGVSGENKDGMDMSLCRINKKRTELVFAGANNPMYLVREGQITEYPGDKQPIGISGGETRQFTQKAIALQKGDAIYICTDGYSDQFGGPKGKKFKSRQLSALFASIAPLPPEEQHKKLEAVFNEWKGPFTQVDDICVIGLKI